MGGRGLPNGGNRIVEVIKEDCISFAFTNMSQQWLDVCAILGPVVSHDKNIYTQIISNQEFNFSITGKGNITVTYWPFSKMDRFIYGFIGALPNIMAIAVAQYGMTKVVLSHNYRFRDNPEMLKLDRVIRENASTFFTPRFQSEDFANLPAFWGLSQQNEAEQIAIKVQNLITHGGSKVALLFRGRGKNAEQVEDELTKIGIPFFYGMFTDQDPEYIGFHNVCQEELIRRFERQKTVNRRTLLSFSNAVKQKFISEHGKAVISLLKLLDALIEKVSVDYADLLPEDKYALLLDLFENRQLKQAMEYVDSKVILSTVHGAKGLEWEYVILCDVERWVFPGYYTCNECVKKFEPAKNCKCSLPLPLPAGFIDRILDELSVFYVGITRAKKQVFVSASAKRLDNYGNEKDSVFSCMSCMPGIRLIKAE